MEKTITIAITGPESSGKTTLCLALGKHFNTPFVTEYAREYLTQIGMHYTTKDVLWMAKKQIELEDTALKQNPALLFCDTDMINFKIWFEFYGHKTPDFIEERIQNNAYSLTLLLYPNTPWIADGIRQNENDRFSIFNLFEKHLSHYNYPFTIINQLNDERITNAIKIIDNINL